LFDSIKAEEKHIVTGFNDLTKSTVFNRWRRFRVILFY
jgi:hypothetical protein